MRYLRFALYVLYAICALRHLHFAAIAWLEPASAVLSLVQPHLPY
jgi:hypothetical protein